MLQKSCFCSLLSLCPQRSLSLCCGCLPSAGSVLRMQRCHVSSWILDAPKERSELKDLNQKAGCSLRAACNICSPARGQTWVSGAVPTSEAQGRGFRAATPRKHHEFGLKPLHHPGGLEHEAWALLNLHVAAFCQGSGHHTPPEAPDGYRAKSCREACMRCSAALHRPQPLTSSCEEQQAFLTRVLVHSYVERSTGGPLEVMLSMHMRSGGSPLLVLCPRGARRC